MKLFEGVRVGDKALKELEKRGKKKKVIAKNRVETYDKATISEAEKAPRIRNSDQG